MTLQLGPGPSWSCPAYAKLEASRGRETGGSGLGLAIARAHGGDISLENRAEGGLRATVALPPADGP